MTSASASSTANGRAPAPSWAGRTISLAGPSGKPVNATVRDTGSGPLVVFLHGLVGLNDHWDQVVARVAPRCRCICLQLPLLELRGSDCSVSGVTEMTIRYLRTLTAEVGQPGVLVGNSFGGHVACRVALEAPELVRGIVLAGASGLIERPLAETKRFAEIQTRPTRDWIEEKIGELFFDRSRIYPGDLDRAHKELNERGKARAMVRLSRSARKNHLGGELPQLKRPALLIWGEDDIVTPPEAAQEFLRLLPEARIEWYERCGHVPMVEHPDRFGESLTGFVLGLADDTA